MSLLKIMQKLNQLYKQHFEDVQRINQQWLNFFWRPFMGQQQQEQVQEKKEDEVNKETLSNTL